MWERGAAVGIQLELYGGFNSETKAHASKKKIHHRGHEEHEGKRMGTKNLCLSSVASVSFVVKCI